ncbi:hypothetical protein Bbelb_244550 [Branchiostoma belcheri]|nr:hypothetical protein Bbelb_244550 [Branchiostoma belcheri]
MLSFKETRVRSVRDLRKGDQLAVDRGPYYHHMIVIEDPIDLTKVSVIHYSNDAKNGAIGVISGSGKSGFPIAIVRKDVADISSNVGKGRVYRVDYDECASPYETVRRARSKLGEVTYCPLTKNCEHFATWCKTGIYESSQSQAFLKKSVLVAQQAKAARDKYLATGPNFATGPKQIAREGAETAVKNTAVVKQGTKSVVINGANQILRQGCKTAVKKTAKSAVKQGAKSVAKKGAKQGMWQGMGQGTCTCKYAVRNTAKSAAKESAKGTMKEGTKAAAKSGGKSFGKEIMENQGALGIGLTVAEEGFCFLSRTSESVGKLNNGKITGSECVKQVATHAVKGVANGTATVVGGTVGQMLFPVPVLGGMIGSMAGKALVWLGGEALAELTK